MTESQSQVASHRVLRRRVVRRQLLLLLVGTGVLIAFIVILGDIRRQRWAMGQSDWYASLLTTRSGEFRVLPLNLHVDVLKDFPDSLTAQAKPFSYLSRKQARLLSKSAKPVLAAWSQPVPRVLTTDGRAVVMYQEGTFRSDWLPIKEFDRWYARQQKELSHLKNEQNGQPAKP